MKTLLKVFGILAILFSLLPGAFSIHQGYAAYEWRNGEMASGRYGTFGAMLAEEGARIRQNRAIVAGAVSFVVFVTGAGLFLVGWRLKGKQPIAPLPAGHSGQMAPPQAYPQPQPAAQYPQS